MAHNLVIVHYVVVLQYSFYIQLYVNNVEVTVNTYTLTNVFTTKDQSDGTVEVARNLWLLINKRLGLFYFPGTVL